MSRVRAAPARSSSTATQVRSECRVVVVAATGQLGLPHQRLVEWSWPAMTWPSRGVWTTLQDMLQGATAAPTDLDPRSPAQRLVP